MLLVSSQSYPGTRADYYASSAPADRPSGIGRLLIIAALALGVTCVACCDPLPAAEPLGGTITSAPRCPPAPPLVPCQPSGKGFCADLVGLCLELDLGAAFCGEVMLPWCEAGESTCALCNYLKDQVIGDENVDVGAMLLECACLGVADSQSVCAR